MILLNLGAAACDNPFAPRENVLFWQVAPEKPPCPTWAVDRYQIRDRPDGPWQGFLGPIHGFAYEAGFLYTIEVGERLPRWSCGDCPNSYHLRRVIAKVRVPVIIRVPVT